MTKATSWIIEKQKIKKLKVSTVGLEKDLESWIEQDPSLVQTGLTIVHRQMIVEGGRLDLLALDPQGRWVVIEVKAGLLDSPVVSQALYYVAHIASMSSRELEEKVNNYLTKKNTTLSRLREELDVEKDNIDSREIYAIVVGVGRTSGLSKLLGFMVDKYGVPVSAVLFDVFEIEDGGKILSRELTNLDSAPVKTNNERKTKWTLQNLRDQAKSYEVDEEMDLILSIVEKYGLYARPYANSIMITPPQNKTRMLFTIWIKPDKNKDIKAFIGSFSEFYPVSEEDSINLLGELGWKKIKKSQLRDFAMNLDALLKKINEQLNSAE